MKPVSIQWLSPPLSTSTVCEWPPSRAARLIDGDLVLRVEQVGSDEPRDAGSDDGNLHCPVNTRATGIWMNSPNSDRDEDSNRRAQFRYVNGMAVSLSAAKWSLPCSLLT